MGEECVLEVGEEDQEGGELVGADRGREKRDKEKRKNVGVRKEKNKRKDS